MAWRIREEERLAVAGNGEPILHPTTKKTSAVQEGTTKLDIPQSMVYIPAGEFTFGTGVAAKRVQLPGYVIGKFLVTNAEYKAFLAANRARRVTGKGAATRKESLPIRWPLFLSPMLKPTGLG